MSLSRKSLYYCRLSLFSPCSTVYISISCPYYGLTINPVNSEVYIADAIDYVQNGVVLRYSPDGELLDEFYVGIIPGAFCWR